MSASLTTSRHSLHRRLAVWMSLSTLATLLVFSGALYGALLLEQADETEETGEIGRAEGAGEEPVAQEASEQMLLAMLIAGPIALVAAVGGALVLSRRALSPLGRVIAAARSMTTSDLRRRLPLPKEPDELYELTTEVNGLFTRLDAGFAALSRYANDASHELRTPLAVVTTELEIALRHPRTSSEWQQSASKALRELERMTRVVTGLLALARAEGPIERACAFDLRQQVDLVLVAMMAEAAARGVSLSRATEGDLGSAAVVGDPDAIHGAVHNVVDNALRYTEPGGRVRVALCIEPDRLAVLVDDTGPGIHEAERERIFDPLVRGPAAGKTTGHGLGLAIVRRVLQSHGGSVEAGASPEGGARFALWIPRIATAPGG